MSLQDKSELLDLQYKEYYDYLSSSDLDLNQFKSHPSYNIVLEHVWPSLGGEYLQLIKNEFSNEISSIDIRNFCVVNDSTGNPVRHNYGEILEDGPSFSCSPSSLRYLYQACLILQHLRKLKTTNRLASNPIHLIEIGAGYGGLALAIMLNNDKFGFEKDGINSYTLVDLDPVIELQKQYLNNFISFSNMQFKFESASTYGQNIPNNSNNFLISNYAFGEISRKHQEQYINHLFPKIQHGFFIWNGCPLYDFGKAWIKVQTERPNTVLHAAPNKFIYF